MTQSLDLISSTTASTSFWLPSDSEMNSFSFDLWSDDPKQDVGGVQWEFFCGNILIDEMLADDHGEGVHNHTFPYITIILRGGYWETLSKGKF